MSDPSPRDDCLSVTMQLTGDGGPGLTHWALLDPSEGPIAQGLAPTGRGEGAEHGACLPRGCATLAVFDEDGDGLVRGGAGVSLRGPDGRLIWQGGDFEAVARVGWCLEDEGQGWYCTGPTASDGTCVAQHTTDAVVMGRAPPSGPVGILTVVVAIALLGTWWWRDRSHRAAWTWPSIAWVAVFGAFVLFFGDLVDEVTVYLMHDGRRDLVWALDVAEGRSGPMLGPIMWGTEGRLGRLWSWLLAGPLWAHDLRVLAAAWVAMWAGILAAQARLAQVLAGGRAAALVAALFLSHHLVIAQSRWVSHANLTLLSTPLALLAAWRLSSQGRSAHLPLLVFWLAVGMQVHGTAGAVVVCALILTALGRTKASSTDLALAVVAGAVPFVGGWGLLRPLAIEWGWVGALVAQTGLLPALWLVWALGRPDAAWRTTWGRIVSGAALLTTVGLLRLPGWSLRLLDLQLTSRREGPWEAVWAPGRTLQVDPWAPWTLGRGADVGAAVTMVALALVGLWAVRRREPGADRVVWAWLGVTVAVAVAAVTTLAPWPRYLWSLAGPVALAAGLGFDEALSRLRAGRLPSWARGGLAVACVAGLVSWQIQGPLVLLVGLAGAATVLVDGPAWMLAALLALGLRPIVRADWVGQPHNGSMSVDAAAWRAGEALGVASEDVWRCTHTLDGPDVVMSDAWVLLGTMGRRVVASEDCPTPLVVLDPQTDATALVARDAGRAVVARETARWSPGTLAVSTWLQDGLLRLPTTLNALPYRGRSDLLPPWTARAGLLPWGLAAGEDGVVATISGVVASEGPAPHTLVATMRRDWTVDGEPCGVWAADGWGPLEQAWEVQEGALQTVAWQLPPRAVGTPVTVEVRGCRLHGLDVFPTALAPVCPVP